MIHYEIYLLDFDIHSCIYLEIVYKPPFIQRFLAINYIMVNIFNILALFVTRSHEF